MSKRKVSVIAGKTWRGEVLVRVIALRRGRAVVHKNNVALTQSSKWSSRIKEIRIDLIIYTALKKEVSRYFLEDVILLRIV
ncbi:hypothetical protein E2C01_020698 [Portunus trituberculatus]|uniref:Uncharacterized protein n=1 Tax=Portunus trituberculatus TaxID=210409 RepID=A0A5B7E312_PORTR|nr:hypothetical protein [Portunus trituberculatus]